MCNVGESSCKGLIICIINNFVAETRKMFSFAHAYTFVLAGCECIRVFVYVCVPVIENNIVTILLVRCMSA